MGNHLTWDKPLPDATWTHVRIERSSTENGTYTEIASQAISDSTYFDVNGLSTSWYRIRFYDSSAAVFSDYSDALQGEEDTPITGQTENDILKRTITAVNILGTLGASGPDTSGNYSLFGMSIHQNVAEAIVRQCYDYTTELIGEDAIVETDRNTIRKVSGFVSNYSALRILGILAGVSITTHYNYTSGGLNIQKPAVSQIKAMLDIYSWETRRWSKLLLRRSVVSTPSDVTLSIINEEEPAGSGITYVSYDSPNL